MTNRKAEGERTDPRAGEFVVLLDEMADIMAWRKRSEFLFANNTGRDYKEFLDIIARGREFRDKGETQMRGHLRTESLGLLKEFEDSVVNPMEYVLSSGENPDSIDKQINNYWDQQKQSKRVSL